MTKEYVQNLEGMYRIVGSRVSLDSIVYAYWNGQTAESIAQSFPTLCLEEVYGAIAFYLANRAAVDSYLEQRRIDYEARREASRQSDPMFYRKMAEARRKLQTTSR